MYVSGKSSNQLQDLTENGIEANVDLEQTLIY